MHYEIVENKKLLILHKSFFNHLHIQINTDEFEDILNIPDDYNILLLEIGESIDCMAFNFPTFYSLLKKYNIKNKVFILTETENEKYLEWVSSFGWTPITFYGFFTTLWPPNTIEAELSCAHIQRWLYDKMPTYKTDRFKKKFFTLNKSFREHSTHRHRKDLFDFLKNENLLNDSYASFRFIPEFDNNFNEQIDDLSKIHHNQTYHDQILIKDLYDNSFLFIITESRLDNHTINLIIHNSENAPIEFESDYITEKTTRVVAANIPFVVIGPKGILKRLRKIGFKTFSEFWDESYDDITDYESRLEKIKEIIKWVASKDLEELTDIYNQMLPIFEHNKKILHSIEEINNQNVLKHIPTIFN